VVVEVMVPTASVGTAVPLCGQVPQESVVSTTAPLVGTAGVEVVVMGKEDKGVEIMGGQDSADPVWKMVIVVYLHLTSLI